MFRVRVELEGVFGLFDVSAGDPQTAWRSHGTFEDEDGIGRAGEAVVPETVSRKSSAPPLRV